MPSKEHELPLDFFRNQPRLAPDLLRMVFGIPLPDAAKVSLGSETYPDIKPAEYRCDATVMVGDPEAPSMGIVVESQLRYDQRKTFTWPVYLATLRARRECPVVLLVLCPDEATAQACTAPIELGHPGWVLQPLTFAPQYLPPITDPGQARRLPEITVLSAPVHADGPDAQAVIRSLCAAIDTLDHDIGAMYHDYAESRLSAAAHKLLEETMKVGSYEWQGDFALQHIAEGEAIGEARGKAKSMLTFLQARGIAVSDEVRERVMSCVDLDRLDLWIQRAATVDTAEQLFD